METFTEEPRSATNIPDQLKGILERRAMVVILIALLIGILGNFLFYDQFIGVNIGLYTLLLVVCGTAIVYAEEIPLTLKHAVFGIPAVVFAGFLAIYSSPMLTSLNVLIVASSLFIFMRFSRLSRFLGGSILEFIMIHLEALMVSWFEGPFTVLSKGAGFLNNLKGSPHEMARTKAVLRGLLLALPILIVFGALLGSADVVLGDVLEDLFGWFNPDEDLIVQLMLIAFLTWVNLILFRFLIFGPSIVRYETAITTPNRPLFTIGMIESGIVLGSVNLLFLAFVILQARYLFGGESNITAQGYTYAEYARRGFYEMLAVSVMTVGLIGALVLFTNRQPAQEKLFRVMNTLLIVLTGVILVAAWRRLALYEDAYGYTQLRVGSTVFMAWLGVLLAILLADVLMTRKLMVFMVGGIICTFGYVATLNVLNMDRFIAAHNVDRFDETGKIDVPYLLTLSDDAIPAIVPLIDEPGLEEQDRLRLMNGLADRLEDLDRDHAERKGVDYHWSKAQAWQALDEYRDELTPYIGRYFDSKGPG